MNNCARCSRPLTLRELVVDVRVITSLGSDGHATDRTELLAHLECRTDRRTA